MSDSSDTSGVGSTVVSVFRSDTKGQRRGATHDHLPRPRGHGRLFVWDRLPIGVVAFGVALSLWATGVLTIDQALGGFGDPTVIFIASLFVVSEALDSTGVTAWAGQQLIAGAGESRTRLIVLMMLTVAVLTALISVNGSVAALLLWP